MNEEEKQQKEWVIEAYKRWATQINVHHEDAFHVIVQALTEHTLQKYIFQLPKDTAILDAGGGDGQWSLYLARHEFTNILLADISPELLIVARNSARQENVEEMISFQEIDIEKMNLSNQYGVVLCLGGVLSHCLNYRKALQNIYNVLHKNGIGIFSVDSFYEAKITAQYVKDTKELELLLSQGISKQFFKSCLPYYTKYFRLKELSEAISQCNFRTLRVHSRPQITAWDLGVRFSSTEDIHKILDEETRLVERKELLDYGYQLEFVVTK
jgi:ubiquinone/menaquinone biosynthesis C-methylase UbiE